MRLSELDYKALRFLVSRSHGTALSRDRFLKKIEKDHKKGHVVLPNAGSWRKSLCCARIMMWDFSNWDGWEFRSDYAANLWLNRPLPVPLWDGTPTAHLVILAEEGIGDEVLYMSLLPEALCRSQKVTVECDPRLETILKRSFPRTQTFPRPGTLSGIREVLKTLQPSAYLPMGELPRYFRKDRTHFPGLPYLKPDPSRNLEQFRGRVGVSWAGNHGREDGLLKTGLLNLQYNETNPLLEEPGIDLKSDIEGLLALCAVLGRVVTVSTSIAHIAGSVGCPVDVIHAPNGSGGKNDMDILNWKWPEGKNPWYGSATAYRNLKSYEMR